MKQILIAVDQLMNCFVWDKVGGLGKADETLSARAWRLRGREKTWGRFQRLVDTLFFWDPSHCLASYVSEVERKQPPRRKAGA